MTLKCLTASYTSLSLSLNRYCQFSSGSGNVMAGSVGNTTGILLNLTKTASPLLRTFAQMFLRILTVHANSHATSCIERGQSDKMNNDRTDGHCYSFAWIYR